MSRLASTGFVLAMACGQPASTPADGSDHAPSCAPQYPDLLASYAARPQWHVAGVDYCVGYPARTVLQDPLTINLAGTSVDEVTHLVKVTGNDIVLDGWAFSGWTVSVVGSNATITNSDFTEGFLRFEPNTTGGTVKYNIFDQNQKPFTTAAFIGFGSGTYDVEYNVFRESFHMHAQFTNGDPGQTIIFKYNLLANAGGGAAQGAHGDWVQVFGGYTVVDAEITYNTVVQDLPGYSTQGWSLGYDQLEYRAANVANNTMVVLDAPAASVNYAVIWTRQWINGTVYVRDNFIDPSGIDGSFMTTNDTWPGPYDGVINISNNIDMVSGAPIQ